MRIIATMTAVMLIGSACTTTSASNSSAVSNSSANTKSSDPLSEKEAGTIQAFEDICLSALPDLSLDAITSAAKKYEIELNPTGNGRYSGSSSDKYLKLDLAPGKNCYIGSEDIENHDGVSKALGVKLKSHLSNLFIASGEGDKFYGMGESGTATYIVNYSPAEGEGFILMKIS